MAYTDILSLQQAAEMDNPTQSGQFGEISTGVTVAQPPTRDPFVTAPATAATTAPQTMAAIRPMMMEQKQPITPEQPTAGQGNAFMMESQKVMKGGQ